jgi:citrate synthase
MAIPHAWKTAFSKVNRPKVNLDRLDQSMSSKWLDSRQATALMGVRPQSLYASVSRGRIHAKEDPTDPRRKLYSRDDVLRFASRRSGPLPSREVAAQAMTLGDPVLRSAISTVAHGTLWYQGLSAGQLASHASLEEVAQLLWQAREVNFQTETNSEIAAQGAPVNPGITHAFARIAGLAAQGIPTAGQVGSRNAQGTKLIAELADAWIGSSQSSSGHSLHRRIALAWGRPEAQDLLRQAMVLLADHELNASTFAVRVAASTGASLAACLLAGLATLSGPLHGGAAARLQALLRNAEQEGVDSAVSQLTSQGKPIPTFGHPLYPDGDIRAKILLSNLTLPRVYGSLAESVLHHTGERPNVDFALAAIARVHALPAGAPLAIFAISRAVGWIAHVREQQASGTLIRPRAQYCGPVLDVKPPS